MSRWKDSSPTNAACEELAQCSPFTNGEMEAQTWEWLMPWTVADLELRCHAVSLLLVCGATL